MCLLSAGCLFVAARRRSGGRRALVAGLLLLVFAAGLVRGTRAHAPPAAAALTDHSRGLRGPWAVHGRLRGDPRPVGNAWLVDLAVDAIRVNGVWRDWPLSVRVTVYDPQGPGGWHAGRGVEAFLALRRERPARNPLVAPPAPARAGGIDVRATLKSFRQFRAREPASLLQRSAATARAALRAAIRRRFGPDAGLARALLLGERGEVPASLSDALARTGLVHLLAISGLHVGVAVGALFGLLRLAGISRPGAAAAVAASLPLLYALVVPRPPVARASIMAAVLLSGVAGGRRGAAINGLALATLISSAVDPWVTRNFGFLLSSGATAAILLLAPAVRGAGGRSRRLLAALSVTVAAQLAVAPLVASATFRIPPAAVALNIVAVPLMTVAMLSASLALLAGGVGAQILAGMASALHRVALHALRHLALAADRNIPAITVPATAIPALWLATTAALIMVAALDRPARGRVARHAVAAALAGVAGLVMMLTIAPPALPPPPVGGFRLVAFDVGQGDALLLESGRATLMIDTGGNPVSDFDPGTRLLAPALRARGIDRLDAVAITHLHADHAGGLAGLLAEVRARAVWTAPLNVDAQPVRRLRSDAGDVSLLYRASGASGRLGDCRWRTLHPPVQRQPGDAGPLANDGSLV
ncbi:MAG: ComEC/Rec2 family competence protein, partial [Acidobacteriota bacterium]